MRERADYGDGYFARPYLLWFVAENPVRNDRLPGNIAQLTRSIIEVARREAADSLRAQLDYAVGLVASGRVAREAGVQLELIDVLVDAGADPGGAMLAALAHRELDAANRLLERGAGLTLPAALCTRRHAEARSLIDGASPADLHVALSAAAFYGDADMVDALLGRVADPSAYSPDAFHPHATPLHHAVDSGSLDAVRLLVEAGARTDVADRIYRGTPLDWAIHLGRDDIADYLNGADR